MTPCRGSRLEAVRLKLQELAQNSIIMDGQMMSKSKLLKVLLLVAIAGGAAWFALRMRAPHPVAIGERAPDFALPSLASGSIALRDFHRQVVVVNFWATWCPPCVQEAPSLEKFAELMRPRGVTVIGVSVDEDPQALARFAAKIPLTFPIARDPDRLISGRYGTFKFPESYIIDRDGRVAEKIVGAADWDDPRIISFVQDLAGTNSRSGE